MELASRAYLPSYEALLATATEVNNYFSIYQNSEIIEQRMMIFNSTVANNYNFGA